MVRPERFELPTYCSGGNRSIHLSYGRAPFLFSLHGRGKSLQRRFAIVKSSESAGWDIKAARKAAPRLRPESRHGNPEVGVYVEQRNMSEAISSGRAVHHHRRVPRGRPDRVRLRHHRPRQRARSWAALHSR